MLYANGVKLLEYPELVLLDKDGTLIDIHHYWASMIHLRAELIVEQWFGEKDSGEQIEHRLIDAMGVDLHSGRMKPDGPVGVKPRPHIVSVAVAEVRKSGVDVDDMRMEALFSEVDRRTSANLRPLLRLLPGVVDFLESLRTHGVAVALVSTDITSRATAAMQSLGIDHYFTTILGGDAVLHTKPAPDLVQAVLRSGSYSILRTVVIGDHPVDILMGQNAGCASNVAVLTGLSEQDAFKEMECVVVSDLTEVKVR
ncbi:HAD family hydrolase [Pseudomonadota bacterium]